MAEVPITLSGVLFDKQNRTQQLVTFMGLASLTGLGVGGGPIMPPEGGGGGGENPPGIWGPPGPWVTPPIANVPGMPGYRPPDIVPVPPDQPNVPPPGSPPVVVPGTTPVHPITPPEAVLIEYPGIGKVVVPKPLAGAQPK